MLSLGLAVPAACTSGGYVESTAVEQGACIALEGRSFQSASELECGRTPTGIARCHWQLSFDIGEPTTSEFSWHYSDVSEGGQVSCRGSSVTATGAGRTIQGTFDLVNQTLVWAGELYTAP